MMTDIGDDEIDEADEEGEEDARMSPQAIRKSAIWIVSRLPENSEDALLVLAEAKRLIEEFVRKEG
jgi:hypothetical protein